MIERIKALVAAGLGVSFNNLSPGPTKFVASVYDAQGTPAVGVCTEYDWQHGGSIDATLEAAVAQAEAHLKSKHDGVKGAA